jgi:hypothetical protein
MDGLTPVEDQPWRYCRDCAATTFRCPQHSSWFVIIPTVTIVTATIVVPPTLPLPEGAWRANLQIG